MLVYGDACRTMPARRWVRRLRACLDDGQDPLQRWRTLLILAGQGEQALADAPHFPMRVAARAQRVTDEAAGLFLRHGWRRDSLAMGSPPDLKAFDKRLRQLEAIWAKGDDPILRIKTPEGFALYALYPEQYVEAAGRWLIEHPPRRPGLVLVLGVRSIGTTLSAVVAAMLREGGWRVRRRTVRPTGPPFERRVSLEAGPVRGAVEALVVDEGPGLSGSSMACVAGALCDAGFAAERVSFLPGHGGEPGAAASLQSRQWWARTRRYVVPLEQLAWNARSLLEELKHRSHRLLDRQIERMEDLGNGQWRAAVYDQPRHWPAVWGRFERPKYRCVATDGRALLWTFLGIHPGVAGSKDAAGEAAITLARRAAEGWTVAPMEVAMGWVAVPWVAGVPLEAADAHDPAVLDSLGRYLVAVAAPPLDADQQQVARHRLGEVLYHNTREALGEAMARQAKDCCHAAHRAAEAISRAQPAYGDGRLAPWEWRRTPEGRLLKLDAAGHDADHTIIGPQSLAWDVAGTIVEWQLDGPRIQMLLTSVRAAGAPAMEPQILSFHAAAYAAFRAGVCALCAEAAPDGPDSERVRLRHAAQHYCDVLSHFLQAAGGYGQTQR